MTAATVIPFTGGPARAPYSGPSEVIALDVPAVRAAAALYRLKAVRERSVVDARGAGFTFRRSLRALCESAEARAAAGDALDRCQEGAAVEAYRTVFAIGDLRVARREVRKLRRAA
jgi:hypothetical protein